MSPTWESSVTNVNDIDKKILLINAESEDEINVINKIAIKKKKKVNVGLKLNSNIDDKTLKKI